MMELHFPAQVGDHTQWHHQYNELSDHVGKKRQSGKTHCSHKQWSTQVQQDASATKSRKCPPHFTSVRIAVTLLVTIYQLQTLCLAENDQDNNGSVMFQKVPASL